MTEPNKELFWKVRVKGPSSDIGFVVSLGFYFGALIIRSLLFGVDSRTPEWLQLAATPHAQETGAAHWDAGVFNKP